jgi:fused signal recognition particle receptor
VIAIQQEFGIPVKYIGVGESIDDLKPFHPEEFIKALFED